MTKLIKLLFATAAFALSLSATAQTPTSAPFTPATTDIKANVPYSAYVQDSRGLIARNPYGLCWRTGYWTPADAVQGCDLPLCVAPQVLQNGVCVTPPPVCVPPAVLQNGVCVTPPPPPAPVVAPPAPQPVSEKVTFAAETLFDFDKAVLRKEGKAALDDLVGKLQGMNLEVIIAVGHTDSIGTDAYNAKLSIRRAEAVKKYLMTKGIEANRIYTEGKGEKQPVADNKTASGRQKNRRVEVEVVGTRTVMK
jgi:OOP family OmpA-OmpF porin